jgi:hypothetical protein
MSLLITPRSAREGEMAESVIYYIREGRTVDVCSELRAGPDVTCAAKIEWLAAHPASSGGVYIYWCVTPSAEEWTMLCADG